MLAALQIRGIWRWVLCILLCIGATLDDIDYINAIRAPKTMNSLRSGPVADDDSDDQHTHSWLAEAASENLDLSAPFLSSLYIVGLLETPWPAVISIRIRSGRAPPTTAV